MRNSDMITDSLEEALENKINKNKERPRLHGNLF
jgi:hypothetical protein